MRFRVALASILLTVGCQSPPEERCAVRPGEASLEIDCARQESDEWADRALDEAQEDMERRGPGGRP